MLKVIVILSAGFLGGATGLLLGIAANSDTGDYSFGGLTYGACGAAIGAVIGVAAASAVVA